MQKVRKSRLKKVRNLDRNHSRKSIKSDNLHVPLTPSTFRKIKTSLSRASTANSEKSMLVNQRKFLEEREPGGPVRLSHSRSFELPDNLAVHFSSFYQNENRGLPHNEEEKPTVVEPETLRNFPKMEFTRQMVQKLEHFAGTQNYGRQVSAVLEDTVESPGFNLKIPPVDNCAPFKKDNDYYPLWYRDPNKMPQISPEKFHDMKEKYRHKNCTDHTNEKRNDKAEKLTKESSSGTEVELESETDSEEDEIGMCKDYGSFFEAKARHLFKKSSKSIGSTKTKDLEDTNSENDSNWSSQTSGEFGIEDAEEGSLDWETEEEENVQVKIVSNISKKFL